MQVISNKENEYVKHIRKLKEKKYRDQNNEYIIEGLKMVEEAIQEKASIKNIIICDDCEKTGSIPKDLMYEIAKYNCIYVTKKVFLGYTLKKFLKGTFYDLVQKIDINENLTSEELDKIAYSMLD